MVKLEIPGRPLPWRAPFIGSRGAFSPRSSVMEVLKKLVKSQYDGPVFTQAIDCNLFFMIPIPKSSSKKNKKLMEMGYIRPATKPDRDNLAKFASDVLEGIVFLNDSQIVGGKVEKWYSNEPKTVVEIIPLNERDGEATEFYFPIIHDNTLLLRGAQGF